MNNNLLFYSVKIFIKIALDIVYFPLWWYSVGFLRLLKMLGTFLKEKWIFIGAGVWIKNIFTPMYGQRDFVSRSISFFVRFFQIVFRFLAFLLFIAIAFVVIFLWLSLPIIIVYLILEKAFYG
jgi:hypothetical protein